MEAPDRVSVDSLRLSGRLQFIDFPNPKSLTPSLVRLALADGGMSTVFQPPENGWLGGAATSPDGKQIALAYSTPPPAGQLQYGSTSLYLMPSDGGRSPTILLAITSSRESLFNPAWSPDGKYLYYAHYTYKETGGGQGIAYYGVERIPSSGGASTKVASPAIWPRISPDGTRLVYVAFDPQDQINDLYLSDQDGKDARLLVPHSTFYSVDAPFFSADGRMVFFSATGLGPVSSLSLVERLFGVQVGEANGGASDWWVVSTEGGQPHRLTAIYLAGLYGGPSPDGDHIAFVSDGGVMIMNADGSGLVQVHDTDAPGAMQWLP